MVVVQHKDAAKTPLKLFCDGDALARMRCVEYRHVRKVATASARNGDVPA
jgi:hypothetical protein